MKKSTQIIATALFLLVGNFAFSQNDSMYVVNGGVVIGKYAISKVDSVIFYNPDSKTSSDTTVTAEVSIVGVWTPTSMDSHMSNTVTSYGIVIAEIDTSFTMLPTDPEWELSEMEFTEDGFYIEDGDTIGTYTHSGDLLTIIDSEGEETSICEVTSTNITLTSEETEVEEEDGMTYSMYSKMIFYGVRK